MADSKLVYPKPVSRKPLTGLKRSPADMALARASYGGPMKEMITTYDNGEQSAPYVDFDLSELTSRTPVKEALRNPKRNATIPTPRRNLKYPDSYDLEKGYTGRKGTQKNDAAERQAETLARMAKGGKVKKFAKGGISDDPYMGNIMGSHIPGAESAFSELRQKPRSMKGRAGTQSGVAPKNRLDSRMSELDKNLADMKAGKVRLIRGPNGKFQFVSTTSSAPKPAASKPAASKPAVPKFAASKALLEGFKDVDEAEVPDNFDRSASSANALMEGFTGKRGTKFAKGGKVKKFVKGGISGDPDMGSSTDQSKDPEFRKKMLKDQISGDPDMGSSKDESKSPSFRKKMLGGEKKYAKGGKVEKESKGMMKKEIAFFKKKKAPKSMIKHEEKEAKGMKCGGKVMKYAKGGAISIDGCATKGRTRAARHKK